MKGKRKKNVVTRFPYSVEGSRERHLNGDPFNLSLSLANRSRRYVGEFCAQLKNDWRNLTWTSGASFSNWRSFSSG